MFNRRDVIYSYDGSFEGFLCCVFASYANKETPQDIYSVRDAQPGLLPAIQIASNPKHARRVWDSVPVKMGRDAPQFLRYAFLTCLPQKELHMLEFMYLAYKEGPRTLRMLAHPVVDKLTKAVNQMTHEAHLYSGFLRFSVCHDVLTASIKPKSFVLPLLGEHFAARFPNERFIIYDETHRQVCAYARGRFFVSNATDITMPAPDADELAYRKLWRMFYDTIAVEGRENYECRRGHMAKRYWDRMTEFAPGEALPSAPISGVAVNANMQKQITAGSVD